MATLEKLFADLVSDNESCAEDATREIARLGGLAVPNLEVLIQSSVPDQRWWAIRTLAQMDAPPVNLIINGLDDPSIEVREAAALALVGHPSPDAVPGLIRALNEPEELLSTLAMNALSEIGKPAIPELIEAYQIAQPKAKIKIMRALAEIHDHRAISLMLSATEDESAMLNYWANEGLERLGLNMVYLKPE